MLALIASKNIKALEKFAKEKKQQIGMESFVKCLVEDGLPDDVQHTTNPRHTVPQYAFRGCI